MQTFIKKDIRKNWSATSTAELGDGLFLRLATHKVSNGNLVTSASCHRVEGNFEVHKMFVDYSERLESTRYPRTTSAVVEAQHARHVANVEVVKAKALAHYATKSADVAAA